MKKGFAIIACAFASLAAFAGMDNLRIMFSTPGTDTYADGTSVKAGERYALVWKANADDAFAISADGTTSGGRIVLVYETRADGRCTPVLFQADDGWMAANGYSGGTWAVYLLDTRLAKGGYAPLGADGLPTVVNASGLAADALLRQSSATDLTGGLSSVEPTAIPQGVTAPVVESIEVKGAFVEITVGNTSPSLVYTLASGAEPGSLAADGDATAENGDVAASITIVAPKKDGGAFFKVIRKE